MAQGGADAFIGCIGLGVIAPGQMAMLTGSSHLHIGMTDHPLSGRGMFGSYGSAVLPGVHVVEGGQTSTGSVINWLRGRLMGEAVGYDELNAEAAAVPPGCEGLVCLDHFQVRGFEDSSGLGGVGVGDAVGVAGEHPLPEGCKCSAAALVCKHSLEFGWPQLPSQEGLNVGF